MFADQIGMRGPVQTRMWLNLIAGGQVDLNPLVTRRIPLSQVSEELAAFDGPTPAGVADVTEFDA